MVSVQIPPRAVKVRRIELESKINNDLVKLFLVDKEEQYEVTLSQSTLEVGMKIIADLTFEERILEVAVLKSIYIFNNKRIFITDISDFTYEFFLDDNYTEIINIERYPTNKSPMFDYLSKHRANAY